MDISSKFCDDFLDKDIRVVVNRYDSFRKSAIFNKGYYVELRDELRKYVRELDRREAWKGNVYSKFSRLVNICETWQNRGLETCKSLYGELINEFIIDPIDEVSANEEWKADIEIKYAMIHLLLDVLYSYCDSVRIIHFSALVYDKIIKMGEQSSEIKEFYGGERGEAEEHILNYVLDTISLICKKERKNVESYIGDVSPNLTKSFSQEFCKKLLTKYRKQEAGTERNTGRYKAQKLEQNSLKDKELGQSIGRYKEQELEQNSLKDKESGQNIERYKEQKWKQDNKKDGEAEIGRDTGRYKEQESELERNREKNQEIIDFGKETYEKPKMYVEEKKEDRTKYMVITLCAIIIAVILFTAGVWMGKQKNAGVQESPELQKRIEQFEEEQKQQSEKIKSLEDELLNLKIELTQLKEERTNEETTDGETTDEETTDEETTDEETTDEETTDEETTDGETTDGETTDGEITDGEITNGEITNGEITPPEENPSKEPEKNPEITNQVP